jgi:hypothetical protein
MTAPLLQPTNALTVVRGTSKVLQATITKPDGSYYDITGGRLIFTVKCSVFDDLPTIQKQTTIPAQGAITLPRQGIAEFYFQPSDTQGLAARDYIFDVWLITASGERFCVVQQSTFVVQAGVTYLPLT